MTDFSAGNLRPTSLDDRRRRPRRGSHADDYQVTVIDGLSAGDCHDCGFREISPGSASLLVRADLRIGQRVRLQQLADGLPSGAPIFAEIIKSRPLTTGRHEVVIEYGVPVAAPKPSESQRRHERRQARVMRIADMPVSKSI